VDPIVAFYLAQGVSIGAGVACIFMMQLKKMKAVLIMQIIVNLLVSANFFLLGGGSGALVSLLGVACSLVIYFYESKNRKIPVWIIVGFIIAYFACAVYNIIVTKDFMEIVPALGATFFVISLAQKEARNFRKWSALNPVCWMPYDLYMASYVMSLVHLGIFVSAVVGMIRLDGLFSKHRKPTKKGNGGSKL
jgi:hypothetical protein